MSTASAVARGKIQRVVTCESCRTDYEYDAERRASGTCKDSSASPEAARERAQQDADARLQQMLKEAVDVVACPQCGAITREMQQQRKTTLGACLAFLAVMAAILGVVYGIARKTGRVYIYPLVIGIGGFLVAGLVTLYSLKTMLNPRRGIRLPPK